MVPSQKKSHTDTDMCKKCFSRDETHLMHIYKSALLGGTEGMTSNSTHRDGSAEIFCTPDAS